MVSIEEVKKYNQEIKIERANRKQFVKEEKFRLNFTANCEVCGDAVDLNSTDTLIWCEFGVVDGKGVSHSKCFDGKRPKPSTVIYLGAYGFESIQPY